jgi:hypothetical protein
VSSISFQSFGLKAAAWIAPRIVIGTVLEKGPFRFPGSAEVPAPRELSTLRIRVQRVLKGPEVEAGKELCVFSPMEWFRHTVAEEIRLNVISYVDPHYEGGLHPDQLMPGMDILLYLGDQPIPAGFPPGAAFQAFGEAHDLADRAEEVVALLGEGPPGEFDRPIRLRQGHRVRFPDGLAVNFLGHSHKRPRVGGPQKEWIDLGLAKESTRPTITLAHETDESGKESWETRRWRDYSIHLTAMPDGEPVIVVRKG